MKIATYNVNGINGRLPVLLRWLESAKPDVVCLQELKAPNDKFPLAAIQAASICPTAIPPPDPSMKKNSGGSSVS